MKTTLAWLLLVALTQHGAAQSVPRHACYIGAVPCGSPAEMARTIARCLDRPADCGSLERPGLQLPSAPPPAAATPILRPAPPLATAPPAPEVARLARQLPIEPALRDLAGRLPEDPSALVRRLGLRAPAGATTDLRDRLPSAEEILRALLPLERP